MAKFPCGDSKPIVNPGVDCICFNRGTYKPPTLYQHAAVSLLETFKLPVLSFKVTPTKNVCSIGEVEGKNDEKTDKEEIKLRKESFLVALTAEVLIGHSGAPKIDWGGGGATQTFTMV